MKKVTLHRHPGQKGIVSGQRYWTEINGIRWEVETQRSPWRPTLWSAHRQLPGTTGFEPGHYETVFEFSRQALVEALVERSK